MRSLLCMIALAITVIFSCCQKAPIDQFVEPSTRNIETRTSETVQVSVVNSVVNSDALTIVFSDFENVDEIELATNQTLEFSNQNNSVSHSLQVLNAQVIGANLSVTFDVTGIDFLNFDIDGTQNIIIIDVSIE